MPLRRHLVLVLPALMLALGAAAEAVAAQPADVPYTVGGSLPAPVLSPAVAADAPYTPLVRSLISQLEPTGHPTIAEITNAARLLQGSIGPATGATACHAVGGVGAPVGTNPSIAPLCFADSVGINIILPPQNNRTTATPEPLAIGSTFDPALADVWGEVEAREGRGLMVTGLFGPEADVSVQTNWERGLDTLGEDPYVNEVLTAAQVNGLQGRGLMAQVKHFAAFSGADRYMDTEVTDQMLHETLLKPFEAAFTQAKAASTMCAYEEFHDTSAGLPGPVNALGAGSSPLAAGSVKTWPLNEAHWSCEQPLSLAYTLRNLWRSKAFVASDFPATHSTSAITEGEAMNFPTPDFFSSTDPLPVTGLGFDGSDPTGDTCANAAGLPALCTDSGARHVGGIPGAGCSPVDGCGLVNAVVTGALPLSVFNQALAEILYQEQRFGLLGCDQSPVAATCTNPGGEGGDRSGTSALPAGPTRGATARTNLGTESGDAAVVERMSEEGAVLLKNDRRGLPLASRALRAGISVTGPGAEYLISAPSDEASQGFSERDAISPLQQLRAFATSRARITYTAAQSPTGVLVPAAQLSTASDTHDGGLQRTSGPGSPVKDPTLDFTGVSRARRLPPGDVGWSGYIYVPRADAYTFRFQVSPGLVTAGQAPVAFTLDGNSESLSAPSSFYCGQYFPSSPQCVAVAQTNAGYTEAGLTNFQSSAATLQPGFHQVQISLTNNTGSPASFRFAYSRAAGDLADAAAAARGKAAAVVFVNDGGVATVNQDAFTAPSIGVAPIPAADVALIHAVAAANPRTIVVMNTADPVTLTPWIREGNVRSVLEMWNAGSEGGTATARLLLGLADPSGHTTMTWPAAQHDTVWGFREARPLFPGDRTGVHPERLNGLTNTSAADCASFVPPNTPCVKTVLDEGIFSGYRFYDREGLRPLFPFGWGLSYTGFRFTHLTLRRRGGGLDVSFDVTNTGHASGATVAQVYVGPTRMVPAGVQQAVRSLGGFARVALAPGRTRTVTVHLGAGAGFAPGAVSGDPRALQYWSSTRQAWVTPPGSRRVWVGDADASSHLSLTAVAR